MRPIEHEGQSAWAVVARRTYATSVEDLWDALTNAERLPRWFLPVSGDLNLGGRYQFEGNAGGTVTACDPPRSFAAICGTSTGRASIAAGTSEAAATAAVARTTTFYTGSAPDA